MSTACAGTRGAAEEVQHLVACARMGVEAFAVYAVATDRRAAMSHRFEGAGQCSV